jgi:RNA polymerase sigma-70 factor (ECF subfamily)
VERPQDQDDIAREIEAARAGDVEALGRALLSCRDYLLPVAAREMGPDLLAKADASDLVQETFLGARRDFERFGGRTRDELRAWLTVILRHRIAGFRRHYRDTAKRAVVREIALGESGLSGEPVLALIADTPTPGTRAIRSEREAALVAALGRLPERYRCVVVWRHQDRLSFEEIGRRLQCSSEAARKLWPRALAQLRKELGPGHDPR